MTVGDPPRQISPDGQYVWDGESWLPRQISPDGQYEWDGQSWAAMPPVSTSRPLPGIRKGPPVKRAIAVVIGLVLMATCVSAIANSPSGSKSQGASTPDATAKPTTAATATPTAKPTATPTAKATANPQVALVLAYSTAAGNIQGVVDADNAVATACGTGVLATCRAGLVGLVSAIDAYTGRLDTLAVPACLQQADRDIRLGLALEKQGAQQGIAGIDGGNVSLITAGSALITQGNDSILKAAGELKTANCPTS